ncbi:hypothetical protein ACFE04_013846 [Oxalis oulophora]
MATTLYFLISTIMFFFFISPSVTIKLKLIHPQSKESPLYVANFSSQEYVKYMLGSSRDRFESIYQKLYPSSDIRPTTLRPPGGAWAYFIKFSIGNPPVPQISLMDTGSTLLWVDSVLCTDCCPECPPTAIRYDPTKSSTYIQLDCDDELCYKEELCYCNDNNQCSYQTGYGSGLRIQGLMGTETFVFETSDHGTRSVEEVVFGLATSKTLGRLAADKKVTGIFGLGLDGDSSFIGTMSYNFSYCVGSPFSFNDHSNLIIGEGAILDGPWTPFRSYNGHYHVTLEGISIGKDRLPIDRTVFERNSVTRKGGVIMDSGTTLTFLTRPAFEVVSTNVNSVMRFQFNTARYDTGCAYDICYKVRIEQIYDFPDFKFYFANKVSIRVLGMDMFYQNGRLLCLGIQSSDGFGEFENDKTCNSNASFQDLSREKDTPEFSNSKAGEINGVDKGPGSILALTDRGGENVKSGPFRLGPIAPSLVSSVGPGSEKDGLSKKRKVEVSVSDNPGASIVDDVYRKSSAKTAAHIDVVVGESWRCTGFYGNPVASLRKHSWLHLQNLKSASNLPWLVGGDFNEILSNEEKWGGRLKPKRQMESFQRAWEKEQMKPSSGKGSLAT